MKPAAAKLPVYEISAGNQPIATICEGVYTHVEGETRLSPTEKAGVRRILRRGFDGMTIFAGAGRQLSISRKG